MEKVPHPDRWTDAFIFYGGSGAGGFIQVFGLLQSEYRYECCLVGLCTCFRRDMARADIDHVPPACDQLSAAAQDPFAGR